MASRRSGSGSASSSARCSVRSALGRAVRETFERRLKEESSRFHRTTQVKISPECRLYEWVHDEKMRFFLVLQMHRSEDRFTIEVAWSKNGEWPEGHVPLPDSPLLASPSGEMRFRIGLLWNTQPDHWWQVVPGGLHAVPVQAPRDPEALWREITNPPPIEDALKEVPAVVDDAIAKIQTFVIPYFERVIAASQP